MNTFFLLLQAPPAPPQGGLGLFGNGIFIILGVAMIWFLMIRPATQEQQRKQSFMAALKKGMKVVTAGGLHGIIVEIHEKHVSLLIDPKNKTVVNVQTEYLAIDSTLALNGNANPTASTKDTKDAPAAAADTAEPSTGERK
jgi:preprotein translocase subunit YajC